MTDEPTIMLQNQDHRRQWFIRPIEPALASRIAADPDADVEAWQAFDVVLRDLKTGKEYKARERFPFERMDDDGGPWSGHLILHDYMLWGHYCGCHRVGSIIGGDDIEGDEECESERWLVVSVTHPSAPGIVLYREAELGTQM